MVHLGSVRRVREIILDSGLAVISFVCVLGVAECVLRLRHGPPVSPPSSTPYRTSTARGFRLVPGSDVAFLFESTTTPVRVRINRHGLRGPELDTSRPLRVLFLGDSVTFGYGVEEDSTFVARIDQRWREQGLPWQAVNGGIENAGIVEERMLLEELWDTVSPSAVVLCFYANDSRPPVGFSDEYLLEDPIDRFFRTHPQLLSSSRLAAFFHFRYRRLLSRIRLYRSPIPARFAWIDLWREGSWRFDEAAMDSLRRLARFDWGAAWQESSWGIVARELETIARSCQRARALLGVAYLPVQVEVEGPWSESVPARRLARLCGEAGLPFFDALLALDGCVGCYLDHCHLTPRAHRIVADGLERWIRGWWPQDPGSP